MNIPARFNIYQDLLATRGVEDQDLLETLPERCACLRALEEISVFFVKHPEVEMLGVDVDLEKDEGRMRGAVQVPGQAWSTENNPAGFSELIDYVEYTLLNCPTLLQKFCLQTVFVPDPAGELDFIVSQSGLEKRIEQVFSPDVWIEIKELDAPVIKRSGLGA